MKKQEDLKMLQGIIKGQQKIIQNMRLDYENKRLQNERYRLFCVDIFNCISEVAEKGGTINKEHWLKRSKEFWK